MSVGREEWKNIVSLKKAKLDIIGKDDLPPVLAAAGRRGAHVRLQSRCGCSGSSIFQKLATPFQCPWCSGKPMAQAPGVGEVPFPHAAMRLCEELGVNG